MSNVLDSLPPELTRQRIVGAAEAATFNNVSLSHWRRLYRTGKTPKAVMVGERKLGWRIGDLIDHLTAKAA
jgi:prophage regulatory protein